METHFPELKGKGAERRFLLQKETALALVGEVINGEPCDTQLEAIEKKLLELTSPRPYWGKASAELEMINTFRATCDQLERHFSRPPEKVSATRFFTAVARIYREAASRNTPPTPKRK